MTNSNPESEPTLSEHLDDAVLATNAVTLSGLSLVAIGAIFEAKGFVQLGGITAISGLALNGLARGARAIVNFGHQPPQV